MLVEDGYVRATAPTGDEWTFAPSFARVEALGTPLEIVQFFVELHGPQAPETARYVLSVLCEQDDATPLIGWLDEQRRPQAGFMPEGEQIVIARHLMVHGICGRARPGKGDGEGQFSDRFDAREYIAAARVHLGMSTEDAERLSMSEFQTLLEMKFPSKAQKRDVPTREEYEATMSLIRSREQAREDEHG